MQNPTTRPLSEPELYTVLGVNRYVFGVNLLILTPDSQKSRIWFFLVRIEVLTVHSSCLKSFEGILAEIKQNCRVDEMEVSHSTVTRVSACAMFRQESSPAWPRQWSSTHQAALSLPNRMKALHKTARNACLRSYTCAECKTLTKSLFAEFLGTLHGSFLCHERHEQDTKSASDLD
jgi:hypothetical protein